MQNLVLTEQKEVADALQRGENLAVFTIDGEGKPLRMVSGIRSGGLVLGRKSEFVQKAIEYIEENYYKEIRLADIADFCESSVSHLCRIFSAEIGQTIVEYILSTKMNNAAYLLVNTDRKVVDIAHEVGCVDCGYFHKRFKKYFGITPVEYRKQNTVSLQ